MSPALLDQGLFIKQPQPFLYYFLQCFFFGFHLVDIVKQSKPSSIGIIAFHLARSILYLCTTGKHKPDVVFPTQVENDHVALYSFESNGFISPA